MDTERQHKTATGRAIEIPVVTFPAVRRWIAAVIASPTVRVELAILILLTALAVTVRVVDLTHIPPGLHGDEGLAGLDGTRAMHEGWIGPYLPSALGMPSGTVYGTAALFKTCDVTGFCHVGMFTTRLSFVIMGTFSILFTYAAFHVMFDRRVAILSAVILSVFSWHVHLSRTAFLPIAWPLMEMATLFFVALGLKTRQWPYIAIAGLCLGGGPYGYLGFPVFVPVLGLYLAYVLVHDYRHRLLEFARYMVIFSVFAVVIALPLLNYIKDPDATFWDRLQSYSVTKSDAYKQADTPYQKLEFFTGRAKVYFHGFTKAPVPDGVDAFGVNPILDRISPYLIVGGLAVAFWNWRKPQYALPIIALIIIPNAALWSTDGMYRRTLGLAPFMALLAALPLALLWREADRWQTWARYSAYYGIAGIVALVGFLNLNTYYSSYQDDAGAKWVFVHEFTEATDYLHNLDSKPYVYFYSSRWSYNYETRLFLAGDIPGEDRSKEFGLQVLNLDRATNDEVVYLFLPPYFDLLPQVAARYPGGVETDGTDPDGTVVYRAYLLPATTRP